MGRPRRSRAHEDAGIEWSEVDVLVCSSELPESPHFMPAAIAEYCGWSVNFAEKLDLGGAASVGMVWRAALAVEAGLCDVVVCVVTGQPTPPDPTPGPIGPALLLRGIEPGLGFTAGRVRHPRSATSARTVASRSTPAATTTSTGGTNGPGPRSRSINATVPSPTPPPSSMACRSRSTTCWSRG